MELGRCAQSCIRMAQHTHLRFAGLQRRSLSAYKLALERFLAFAHRRDNDVIHATDLDYILAGYLKCMYQEGEPVSAAGHALCGIKRFVPELRVQLPTASQYFRNWQRCHRPFRAVPISWDLLQAMAAICWDQGSRDAALLLYVASTVSSKPQSCWPFNFATCFLITLSPKLPWSSPSQRHRMAMLRFCW